MTEKNNILIINTGGTFNKKYDPVKGELYVEKGSSAIKNIFSKSFFAYEILEIIGKDSLEMNSHDRLELLAIISQSSYEKILVIHGTDTMHVTAEYLHDADTQKQIVFTGAMIPYEIDPVEATANFTFALGIMQCCEEEGVFIAMHGLFDSYKKIKKDREKGKFVI